MKQRHILIFSISSCLFLFCSILNAQESIDGETTTDTLIYKQKYGLRLGVDLGRLIRTVIDDDYTGFEISGDYRLTKKLYLAGELGNEKRSISTDFLSVTANGSYFKAGIDYNSFQNWLDMQNMIYFGFRAGASSFTQNLDNYTIYNTNQYWPTQLSSEEAREIDGLTAIWAEIIIGIKAELFSNLFLGLNVQIKSLINEDVPDDFENLYIPGFNRTYDSGRFGIGFGYNLSYLIPIIKKDKKVVVDKEE
ncbi:DUF6048 family protein [Psychroserpens ponticola]|uniref:DUF6048 family protein n=1 Tax=Psychroserpens ponticola TaxID=2932268 RepID=A0ABY7S137_9FLAO|nr:DUF6048 family protein [Psychroserpens ponticola]WCO03007.1 DUF6048 family protein [Psychroserpens ponticola]